MKEIINSKENIYLYDDRSKCDDLIKVTKILFENDNIILCDGEFVFDKSLTEDNEYSPKNILINKKSHEVKNQEFDSWIATSDPIYIEELISMIQERLND